MRLEVSLAQGQYGATMKGVPELITGIAIMLAGLLILSRRKDLPSWRGNRKLLWVGRGLLMLGIGTLAATMITATLMRRSNVRMVDYAGEVMRLLVFSMTTAVAGGVCYFLSIRSKDNSSIQK